VVAVGLWVVGAFLLEKDDQIPLLVATALATLRFGVLPRWFGWVSLALALILAIPPIGWLGVLAGFPLWVLVTSVLLSGKGPAEPVAAPQPQR
jgi:hypothetical protein